MDPTLTDPAALVAPLAKLAAVGAAITGLTEVCKIYLPEERVAPPLVSATIALLWAAAWALSQPVRPTPADALPLALLWWSMFSASIGVYHAANLTARLRDRRRRRVELARARLGRPAVPAPGHPPPPETPPPPPEMDINSDAAFR
jgi:hypothetical protein